jgi:hypothetical protein
MFKKIIYSIFLIVLLIIVSSVQADPFSIGAAADIEIGNDTQIGPNSSSNGTGLGIRDISTRRRVTLISYNISGLLGPGESFSDVSFSHYSHDQDDQVSVYGVLENLDVLNVEALTWNTAPGVQNNPTPALDSPVALDVADLTGVLLTFTPPASAGVRFSTATSQALADFLNSDTDGIVTFLLAPSVPGTQAIIRSSEHSSGGSLLQGNIVKSLQFASNPNPANGAQDVCRDVVLSWKPGQYAAKHDVYFGTTFADVNEADTTNHPNVQVSFSQDANTYDPAGLLTFGQTYYWKVDEVNAPPASTVYKGSVWSFTVEPVAYRMSNITATASSSFNANMEAGKTIDGSGLNANDQHGTTDTTMWLSATTPQPTWIKYEFDKLYKLYEMWVWNSNQTLEPTFGFGLRSVTIEYSADGAAWTQLGGVPDFARATGAADYVHDTTVNFNGAAAKFVKITANSNWGGLTQQYGLSEVRFFSIPVYAREPNPTNGQTDAALDAALRWRAGREAATHKLYFSDNRQYVADGAVTPIIISGSGSYANYGPLSLNLGDIYYWKVNEVNDAAIPATWQGDVWSFTTIGYTTVDNFEDYNDYKPDRIWENWIDGWGVPEIPIPGNGTCSTVGYGTPPFAETRAAFVHSGTQSMPFDYNNIKPPYYSQADHTFDTPQNWTGFGIKALTLWLKGVPAAFLQTSPGVYFTSGTGADIYGAADEGRFIYKQLTGDGTIIARVDSLDNTHAWAKAGVMIRETLDAGSSYAYVIWAQVNGVRFQARLSTGASATSDTSVATPEQIAIRAPAWVKLERNGNQLNGYYATDAAGTVWTPMVWNPQTITMVSNVYIGLAVTSHASGVVTGAGFSSVSTTGSVTGDWQLADLGVAQPIGGNKPDTLYVMVEDSIGGKNVVTHSDPNIALRSTWQEWNIPLNQLTGVNLGSVKKMHIGVGNKTPGGAGQLYFDDIRLNPARCMPSVLKNSADFNSDCVVDYLDLDAMAAQWLMTAPPALSSDLNADNKVDLKDYAMMADTWLDELLWPQ